jgi:tol-pal system protein YbgF
MMTGARAVKAALRLVAVLLLVSSNFAAHAALFGDDEARRAILDLREEQQRSSEENTQLRRSLVELQGEIDTVRSELATLRGSNEKLSRDLAELQRQQKDLLQGVDERLRRFEPVKVSVDGREFMAEQAEKREFDAALAIFRKGEFGPAQLAFADFIKRYGQSGYVPSAFFWLGNAQYATRDYKLAVQNFRSLLTLAPDHLRASEAVLSIANCQLELKDTKAARKTLEELLKAYPQSEAAATAKERLARLK